MFWDIALPVLAALAQGLTGFLGWRVTVDGVVTRRKRLYEWLFASASVIGIVAVGIAAYRGTEIAGLLGELRKGQQQESSALQEIRTNPPTVTVNTPPADAAPSAPKGEAILHLSRLSSSNQEKMNGSPTGRGVAFVVGRPVQFNLYWDNDGTEDASDVKGYGEIFLTPDDSLKTEKALVEQFKKALAVKLNEQRNIVGGSLAFGGHQEHWLTAQSNEVITQADIARLTNGSEIMWVVASEMWRDTNGEHFLHLCEHVQPPAFDPEVWQVCREYGDHK